MYEDDSTYSDNTIPQDHVPEISDLDQHLVDQNIENNENSDDQHDDNIFSNNNLPDFRNIDSNSDKDTLSEEDKKSRDEFTTVYDIIDDLSELIAESRSGFFTSGVVRVNRDEYIDKINLLKSELPVQLERASALMREAERRLDNAQTQANSIISSAQSRANDIIQEAQNQADFLAGQEHVAQLAREKAHAILDKAQEKSDYLTQGADKYCLEMMQSLQTQIDKMSTNVTSGIQVIKSRQSKLNTEVPQLTEQDYPED
ncbi:MAG: ATP synthase F0 subunit B [Bifidobacteriaceae bacterium]|nr:ATP synthase F0 subunit B [Bifidobacteriaceae bacterium]